jgi:hypothetical protein
LKATGHKAEIDQKAPLSIGAVGKMPALLFPDLLARLGEQVGEEDYRRLVLITDIPKRFGAPRISSLGHFNR